MKFEFYGREFDADRPICVLGYSVKNSWLPLSKDNIVKADFYPLSCKKFYVSELRCHFSKTLNKNEVLSIMLIPIRTLRTVLCDCDRNQHIVSHSIKECFKIFEEWRSSV